MSAVYNNPGMEMKKALYGEVLGLRTYYEILKKVKSDKDMTHILKIIDDNHSSISFWKRQLRLHSTDTVFSFGEWSEIEKFSGRALNSHNRERVGNSLLQTEEIKLDNYKRLARSSSIDGKLKSALEQNIIPMHRNHSVLLETVFKRIKK